MLFVVGTTAQNNGGGVTSAIDTTGADLIVLSLTCARTSILSYVGTISDNKGNTWLNTGGITQADGSNNAASTIVYCVNPIVGQGHTFTYGGGAILQSICVGAYSGANGGIDSPTSGGSSLASFTVQPGSVTPNQNNSLIIVCGTAVQVAPTLSINQSFIIRENQPLVVGQTYGSWIMDLFQGTAAAVNPTITSNLNTNGMGALTFVFKGAAPPTNINLIGTSSTSTVGSFSPLTEVDVNLSGISTTSQAGLFSINATSNLLLTGISATSHADVFSITGDSNLSITGIAATASFGSFHIDVDESFHILGVATTAAVNGVTVFVYNNAPNLPVYTIMRNNPVPATGTMTNAVVACRGAFL